MGFVLGEFESLADALAGLDRRVKGRGQMRDTIFTVSIKSAENLKANAVPLPGGTYMLQLCAPGRGDVNLYFPSYSAMLGWLDRITLLVLERGVGSFHENG